MSFLSTMDPASYQVQIKLQLAAAKAKQDMFNEMNPGFWDVLKTLPVPPPFVPEVGKIYRNTFVRSGEKSTVLCLKNNNKEKPGSVQIMELRRGDLTGKKLDKKLFDSWEEYQDFLMDYEPECTLFTKFNYNCKCEDCRSNSCSKDDDYDSDEEYW